MACLVDVHCFDYECCHMCTETLLAQLCMNNSVYIGRKVHLREFRLHACKLAYMNASNHSK